MIIRALLYSLILSPLFFSCAKQSAPSGGPKDTIPPILVKTFPENRAINFKGKKLELEFDEDVIVNSPLQQLIITPTTETKFEAIAKKNTVIFTLEDELADSTTYTFNFRQSIQDITEKNTPKNLKLAFSTGSFVDSLSIEGRVYNLHKGSPEKDIAVGLYLNKDTFNIFTHKPAYFTETNKKGEFILENLKQGIYYIYAFHDRNKNLLVDSKNEPYGFLVDSLELRSNIKNLAIPIINLDARPVKLIHAKPYKNYYNIRTSKTLKTYSIQSLADSVHLLTAYGEDKANIRVYNPDASLDSIPIHYVGMDSMTNKVDTILYVKFNLSEKKIETENFTLAVQRPMVVANKGILETQFNFNKPVTAINFDSLYIQIDSTITVAFTQNDIQMDSSLNQIRIKKILDKKLFEPEPTPQPGQAKPPSSDGPLPPKKTKLNRLYLGKAAFISVDKDSSTYRTEPLEIFRPESSSVLLTEVKCPQSSFVLHLIDKSFKLVREEKNKPIYSIEDLRPMDYQLKLIVDKNGNGVWDQGNYFQRVEPEQIRYYKTEKDTQIITLKANWEVGPLLITCP